MLCCILVVILVNDLLHRLSYRVCFGSIVLWVEEESRRANEERMRRVRRMQVGDVCDLDALLM